LIGFYTYIINTLHKGFGRYRLYKKLQLKFPAAQFSDTMTITGPIEHLSLGNHVLLGEYVHLHLGGQKWSDGLGKLTIGNNCIISCHCVLFAVGKEGIVIGNNFDCAPGVKIFASKSYFENGVTKHHFGKVHIGNQVVVYANTVIGPGVTIGDNITIAANSVVTQDLREAGLYGGCPAKKIT
jgi:maltose O-acetyltransferase